MNIWANTGTPQQQPPGASGVPQMPQGHQSMPQQPRMEYSVDHLPPPPGQQPQQGNPQSTPSGYSGQPGVPGQPQTGYWQPPQGQPQGDPRQPQMQPPTQPQWPQHPSQQPPQQRPQPSQQPGRVELNDTMVLDGPGVPQELRGRTWGQARQLYSALSNEWLQRQRPAQTPAEQSLVAQRPPQAPQPVGGQAPQPATQPQRPQFWQDPERATADIVRQTIQETVMPALQPVMQRTQAQGIMEARNVAASGIPDFQSLEPAIMEALAPLSPEALQNPAAWANAADLARGRLMRTGQYQAQQSNGGQRNSQSVPAYSQPPVHSFFSESPSAPNVGPGGGQQSRQPSQEDHFYAQKWQMPIGDFMAWKYGTQPQGSF